MQGKGVSETERGVQVLLVEDDDDHADLAMLMLARSPVAEFTVDRVASGQEALEQAAGKRYDALLLDYYLHDGDGLTLLEELRSVGVETPALLLTGLGSEEIAARALRARADDYLPKDEGLSGDTLARTVRAMVERHRLREELAVAREQAARAEAAVATGKAVAHDLATPLSLVVGLAELLLRDEPNLSPTGRAYLQELLSSAVKAGELLARLNRIAEYTETSSPVGPILDLERATRAD
jgi:DNA-binding response OmpR family regulator